MQWLEWLGWAKHPEAIKEILLYLFLILLMPLFQVGLDQIVRWLSQPL